MGCLPIHPTKARWRAADYALMVGLAFLVVGGAGFLFFQLHLGQ